LFLHFHLSPMNHLFLMNRLLPLCPKCPLNRLFLHFLKSLMSLKLQNCLKNHLYLCFHLNLKFL
jgi:hypothetical protein